MMNEDNNNDSSQSANDYSNHSMIEGQLSFSPITNPPSQDKNGDAGAQPAKKNDGDNESNGNDANYENPSAAGVEENIFVSPRSLLPPSTPEDTTKKRNRERES